MLLNNRKVGFDDFGAMEITSKMGALFVGAPGPGRGRRMLRSVSRHAQVGPRPEPGEGPLEPTW